MLARNATARKFFLGQIPSYRRAATWWVLSARLEATRLRRVQTLVALSAQLQLIPAFIRRSPQKNALASPPRAGIIERIVMV